MHIQDKIAVICMVATLAIAVYYNERNYRVSKENQALSREQFEYIKNRQA